MALNTARTSLANLSGTGAGGFLFAVGRVVPFAVDMASHAAAFLALTFLRLPPREPRAEPAGHLHREMLDGLRWVWRERVIRVTTGCAVVLNLFFSAFYLVVIVLAHRRGVPAGAIGVIAAMLGAGGLVGALIAPYLHGKLTPFASIAAVFWALTVLTPVAIFLPSGYLLGALFFAMALLPPTANTTIMTRQLLITPDHLRGRLGGVLGLVVGGAGALGPVLGGVLTQFVPGRQAVLVCAAGMAAITVLVTASPTLRHFPRDTAGESPGGTAGETADDGSGDDGAPVDVRHDSRTRNTSSDRGREGDGGMDEDIRYQVLRNDEEQYSLWPADHEVPDGWYRVGREGSKEECSAYVDEVWTDMRPRSLRERMDAEAQS